MLLKSKETQLPYLNSKLSVKEVIQEEKPAQVGKVPTAMITLNYSFMNKLLIFNTKCITAWKLTQETDSCLNAFERKCLRNPF